MRMYFENTKIIEQSFVGDECQGFLWIGDPHLWSKKPGRRTDEDFAGTVLEDMLQGIVLCNQKKMWPIIPGDLLHNEKEADIELITRLLRLLKKSWVPPLVLVGNHDINGKKIQDRHALKILIEVEYLIPLEKNTLYVIPVYDGKIEKKVGIFGIPYGEAIPREIFGTYDGNMKEKNKFILTKKKEFGVEWIAMITHHDLAFEGAYPTSLPLHEIIGVDAWFNGHMHSTKRPVKKDTTSCYNPGNITPISVDLSTQEHKIWEIYPWTRTMMETSDGTYVQEIIGVPLKYRDPKMLFDYTGYHVVPAGEAQIPDFLVEAPRLEFVEQLSCENNRRRTDEAVNAREALGLLKNNNIEASDFAFDYLEYLLEKSIETK